MAKKQKNLKADKPIYSGGLVWDGNLTFTTNKGVQRTIRTDLGGMQLHRADPNKEIIVLVRQHVGYNELDHGYIVRAKHYDDGKPPFFGLKEKPDDDSWSCFNYCDVIAWGYADGGLNDPTLYYSCQSTVEEEIKREKWRAEHGMKTHAERLAEMEDEEDELPDTERRCVMLKMRKDGELQYHAVQGADEELERGGTKLMHACAKAFCDLREEHPEVTEAHFYTDDEVKIEK